MQVLMFGWEFPPHISGGLGTACYGLTSGLIQQNVNVIFVVPKLHGEEDKSKFTFINATDVVPDITNSVYINLKEHFSYLSIPSGIKPYVSPQDYAILSKNKPFEILNEETAQRTNFNFKGNYGNDLLTEVTNYAIVAGTIAKKNKFDIIHAHDWLTYPAGIAAKQISGKPLIIHVHATEFDRSGKNINKSVFEIEKKGMLSADSIIAVSNYTKNTLITKYGILPEKINVVHNGVAALKQNVKTINIKPKIKIVTFLGRITFQKGPDYFIEAAKKVLLKHPETRFVMAGNGDMLKNMIKRVAELKISSRFHFTGFLKNTETTKIFEISDVYVMPSVSEPFGISPLEAVNSGVPVIISKQSGVSEVLKSALKVDFWDTDAIAEAICAILNHQSLACILKNGASKEIEQLEWKKSAKNVKKLYASVIKNNLVQTKL